MRIVIDLQGAQASNAKRGIGRYSMSIAKAIARNAGEHEVIIVLSDRFPETIMPIRDEFKGLVLNDRIVVFSVPGPVAECYPDNSWRVRVAELIREHFILSLDPDVLLVTLGSDNSSIFSMGPVLSGIVSVIAIDNISVEGSVIDNLSKADCIIILPPLNKEVLLQSFDAFCEEIEFNLLKNAEIDLKSQELIACSLFEIFNEKLTSNKKNFVLSIEKGKPLLAYVSPLPPEKSGISDYSAELLPYLSAYYNIVVIVEQDTVEDNWIKSNCAIKDSAWLIKNKKIIDRVLYHFGNSYFHSHMVDLVKNVPGVVVLHDFFLSGMFGHMEFSGIGQSIWSKEIYSSHGYFALSERFKAHYAKEVVYKYPVNFGIIKNAQGIIVHSNYSSQLAVKWYSNQISKKWVVIPHLRVSDKNYNYIESRKILGFNEDDFIICSFGIMDYTKLNHRLVDAFISSSLVNKQNCVLVFVGQRNEGEYGETIFNSINRSGLSKRIRITGWTDSDMFKKYLAAADVAVQLRTLSRGETSGTILDSMNHGIATIVNANGSMAELPQDAVWMLQEEFSDDELVGALETLYENKEQRMTLGKRSREVIQNIHNPEACAKQYHKAIENFYSNRKNRIDTLLKSISEQSGAFLSDNDCKKIAKSIDLSFPEKRPAKQILLDITATFNNDLKTGIERVARAIMIALIESPPDGYRVEPCYLDNNEGVWNYRYARKYTLGILNCSQDLLHDDIVAVQNGDILFGLDISGDKLIDAKNQGLFQKYRNFGVKVFFMIHDLLPLEKPDFFPPNSSIWFKEWLHSVLSFDGAVSVSRATSNSLMKWMHNNEYDSGLFCNYWSHHGADINKSDRSSGLPVEAKKVLEEIKSKPSFLMVGTIEPRKGYLQTIKAFEKIWENGFDTNLVIIGNEGWKSLPNNMRRTIPEIVRMLHHHPELNKRLFWLQGISDEYLDKIYEASTCLIAASEAEGFGLPLIEAAQHKLPIIARDIPVFREVAGEHAFYFENSNDPVVLAEAVKEWLTLYNIGEHIKSDDMPWLTWAESAKNLAEILLKTNQSFYHKLKSNDFVSKKINSIKNIYVDISVIGSDDFKTGIQRVTRALLFNLVQCPPIGFNIVPVSIELDKKKSRYKTNFSYLEKTMNLPFYGKEENIRPKENDIFLGLDLAGGYVVQAASQNFYNNLRMEGVEVYFIVYDLLPVILPQFFNRDDSQCHNSWLQAITQGNGIICISESVANDYRKWLKENNIIIDHNFLISSFFLGADLENSISSYGFPGDSSVLIKKMEASVNFLMVGTIEPRKGYTQVLKAFELLWQSDYKVNLIIVGNIGWSMKSFVSNLKNHKSYNNNLFWLKGISDEYLEMIYRKSTCLIVASEGEGFGLPLIEAAKHKLPIIARDIPVFQEVAGEHAFYFENSNDPVVLVEAVKEWLTLYNKGEHIKSDDMPWLTWAESARMLINTIINLGDI